MNQAGEISMEAINMNGRRPVSREVVGLLENEFRTAARSGEIRAIGICLEVRLGEFRTFHEGKNEDVAAILGEWSRLWEAYRPKLFEYVHFPALVRTNAAC